MDSFRIHTAGGCELSGVIGTLSGLVCYTDCMQKGFNIHIIGHLMSRESLPYFA